MKKIDEDFFFEYYQSFIQGIEIMHRRNKFTGEIMIMVNDKIAQDLFGFESMEKMMQDQEVQKIMQDFHNRTQQPLFKPYFNFSNNDTN